MKIIYFGTPDFAAEVLSDLLKNGVEVLAVVTKPDRAQGRSAALIPTPVKCIAQSHSPAIPVFQPEIVSAPEYASLLLPFQADLFVVVAYGEIIKQHLLDMPKTACINVHASLLPGYRGAAPIQRCIMNGEKETGITIMHMAKKMDAGDIIAMEKVAIGEEMTYGELEKELCHTGSKLLLKTIHDFEKGISSRTVQNHSLATLAPKIEIKDCQIDWHQPVQIIHNLIRGVNPHPGAWCQVMFKGENKRFRVLKATIASLETAMPPGQIMTSSKKGLDVSCGKGILSLLHIQLEGKKAMSSEEFTNGLPAGSLQFMKN